MAFKHRVVGGLFRVESRRKVREMRGLARCLLSLAVIWISSETTTNAFQYARVLYAPQTLCPVCRGPSRVLPRCGRTRSCQGLQAALATHRETQTSEKRFRSGLAAALAAASLFVSTSGAVMAQDDADVEYGPPVLDQAKVVSSKAGARLVENLESFEEETGYRILVLTEDPQRMNKSPKELKKFWGLPDPNAIIVLVRPSSGNILAFNYGDNIKPKLPDRFFGELVGRLGNKYNVADVGADGTVRETVTILETCLRKDKGCFAVPGIGKDQYTATLVSSAAGGVFFGFSALTSAQFISKKAKGEDAIFKYAPLLFFPLWGLFFVGLGLNPLLQREADIQLILQNTGAFLGVAASTGFIYPKLLGVWNGYL
jgi:hypothetical protein